MLDLNKDNFDEMIEEGLVVVDFWGKSCEPCKALMPHYEDLSKEFENIKFAKFDVSAGRRVAIRQRVLGLPTIVLYKDGKEIERLSGQEASKDSIENLLKKYE